MYLISKAGQTTSGAPGGYQGSYPWIKMACVGSWPLTLSSAESKNEGSYTFTPHYNSVALKGTMCPS
jgi:hypothetical protein